MQARRHSRDIHSRHASMADPSGLVLSFIVGCARVLCLLRAGDGAGVCSIVAHTRPAFHNELPFSRVHCARVHGLYGMDIAHA